MNVATLVPDCIHILKHHRLSLSPAQLRIVQATQQQQCPWIIEAFLTFYQGRVLILKDQVCGQ